jgi:hypothetical protein
MRVEYVMVADAAQVVGGKLYVLGGGWNQYRAASFPVPMSVSIVTSVLVESAETEKPVVVTLTIADEDGIPVVPAMHAQVQVGRAEGSRPPYRLMLPINATIQIPREGRYAAQVTAGDSVNDTYFDVLFVGKKVEVIPSQMPPLH